jgi:peptide/nickel transport system substrate-binding protein
MRSTIRVFLLVALAVAISNVALAAGELRFALPFEPKTLEPNLATDDASETIQFLTAGVLIRVHRQTQELQPELAESWKVAADGKSITFNLRKSVRFSDGTPFTSADVAHTVRLLMDPERHSPLADSFRVGDGKVEATAEGPLVVTVRFPARVAGVERLFDGMAIQSAKSPAGDAAVLGPFVLEEHRAGAFLVLKRNPNYWKKDKDGQALPYLDAIRIEIQGNPELESMRFRRGQFHLMSFIEPNQFDRLARDRGVEAVDVGASLDMEILWFNQVAKAPIEDYKKAWFTSREFRRAISEAVNRDDLCRVVYRGHAVPGLGPISPANRFWRNAKLDPHGYAPDKALARLTKLGFKLDGDLLRDGAGNAVEFSVITNAGNRARERMAVVIQEDLRKIGIKLNVVPLDFNSLLERITRNFNYELCLLGFANVDLDPTAMMNIWLSSAHQHPWNPAQEKPATKWEAEIDKLLRLQASTSDRNERKKYVDRFQEIVWTESPMLFLVHKNVLVGHSKQLGNVEPSILRPPVYWNVEYLTVDGR